jgi:GntR family transcriptional regulator/MocR family aminotransferase
LSSSRGVNCAPEQIAIVSGLQEALDFVGRIFLKPGDQVCMENPGYTGAVLAFQAYGAKIVACDLDDEGVRLEQLPRRGVRLLYITPAHQFPLGTTMSVARRLQILEWARKSSAVIFEDDYDSEFRFSGRPIPALQGLDRHGLVLYAGSFSKVLFPGLRLGYVVLPPDVINAFEAAKSLTSRHSPILDQVVLSEFISEGHFARHIRRMRQLYGERLSMLLESARQKLAGMLTISDIEAGLQTVGWLGSGLTGESVAAAAAKRNVDVTPISRYRVGRAIPEALQLGFAALDEHEIRRGVRELGTALEGEWARVRRHRCESDSS